MSQEILIKAGQQTRADLVYDEQPGAEVLDNTRLLLQYDPNKLIYLDTATGNDSNSGLTPALAKLTYAAAATAIGGGRDTVQVENDGAVIDVPITAPTQVKPGINARISMNAANRRYGAWVLETSASTSPIIVRNPVSGLLGLVNTTTTIQTSVDDGQTWGVTANGLSRGISLSMYPIFCAELNGFSPRLTSTQRTVYNLGAANTVTASPATIAGDVSEWTIANVNYAPTLGQFIGAKIGAAPFYLVKSVSYPLATGWEKLESAALQTYFDLGWYVGACVDLETAIMVYVTDGTQGRIFTKAPADSDFVERYTLGGGTLVTVKKLRTGTAFLTNYNNNTALYVNDSFNVFVSPVVATDAEFDPATNQIYVVGNNLAFAPDQRDTFVYDTNGVLLYSWTNTGSAGSSRIIQVTPTRLLSSLYNSTFVNFNLFSFPITAAKIQNNVAGFDILDGDFSAGALQILSCTRAIFTATANVIKRCRAERIANTNNTFELSENLCASALVVASPAAQDDVQIISNTIGGKLTIINTAATNRESIKDNIIEGGITATFPVTVLSGNTRGANTNAIFSSACFFNDPQFVDLIDYRLKYKSQGFTADSPLIRKSLTFKNSIGERRNLGAYSAYEINKTFIYDRAFSFLKPSREGLKIKKNTQANLIVSIDGTPDVATNPDGQWEELSLSYGSLPNQDINDAIKNHIAFIDYLDTLLNTACEIIVDPDYAPATSAIVNGVHAIGAIVLALDPSNILAGDRLQVGADIYFVLYKSGDSVVLHTPLKTAVADNQVLPVFASAPGGIYQYVPEAPRQLSRWQSDRTDFLRGASLRFARKWV